MFSKRDVEINDTYAQTLQSVRGERGLTQQELANESGVSPTYISQMERGIKVPTLQVLFDLCDACNVTPAAFVRRMEK